eukprot:1875695-Pyramimonas_sp.AAC.1
MDLQGDLLAFKAAEMSLHLAQPSYTSCPMDFQGPSDDAISFAVLFCAMPCRALQCIAHPFRDHCPARHSTVR